MKKWVKVATGLTVTAALAAGCGGGTKNEGTPSAAPGASAPAAQQTTIKFMVWSDTAMERMYTDLAQSFTTKNPNIKVEIVKGETQSYNEKLSVALTGGTDLDAFAVKNLADFYKYASTGRLVDLGEKVKSADADFKGINSLFQGLQVNGKTYGIPFRNDVWALYYNKKIFDDAKIAYPKADMTWEEYVELAKSLTKGEGQSKIWGSFMPDWPQTWYGYGQQLGKSLYSDDLAPYIQGLKLRKQLSDDKSQPTVAENKATNAHYRAAFLKGNIAMVVVGTWFPGMLEQDKKDGKLNFDWDMTYVPHAPGAPAQANMATPTVNAISNDSKKKDQAFEFLKYVSSDEGQKIVAKYQVPASSSEGVREVLKSAYSSPINLDPIFNYSPVPERELRNGITQLDAIVTQEGERALLGEITPEQALENVKSRIKKEIQ